MECRSHFLLLDESGLGSGIIKADSLVVGVFVEVGAEGLEVLLVKAVFEAVQPFEILPL
jgi:hypothetical protein